MNAMHVNPYYRMAQHPDSNHLARIKVIGEGKVSIQPDKADITIGVITEDRSLEQAQAKNAAQISNIKNAITALGIDDKDIQTIDYSIFPQYDFVDGKQVFRNYRVEHSLQISVKQIQNVGTIIDTAVRHGANHISNIQFGVSDYSRHYHQALAMAILDARRKAETIANILKITINKVPFSVIEHPQEKQGGPIPFAASLAQAEASTPIQPGTLHITSTVTAKFS